MITYLTCGNGTQGPPGGWRSGGDEEKAEGSFHSPPLPPPGAGTWPAVHAVLHSTSLAYRSIPVFKHGTGEY